MSRRVELFVFVALLTAGALALGMCIATTLMSGVGWDSGIDTLAAIQVRELSPSVSLADSYAAVYSTSEFYGILVQSLADGLRQILGGSGFLDPGDLVTYRLQGLVTVAITGVAVALAALSVFFATRSKLAAAFAWSMGLAVPLVMGLTAVYFKDAPVAAGLLMVSSGISVTASLRNKGVAWVSGTCLIASGGFVAMGVRIGSWPLLALLVGLASVILSARAVWQKDLWRAVVVVGAGVSGGLISIIGILLLNPIARIDLPHWIADAYLTSKSFPWEGTVRVLGQDVNATSLPWWYALAWFLAQVPILVTVASIAGVVSWVWLVLRARRTYTSINAVGLAPFFIQAFILPLVIILSGAVLYDGIRHLLFAVPPLAAVMACTMAVVELPDSPLRSRGTRWVPVALLLVPLVSLVADFRWFPYQYAHLNPVAARWPGDRPWEVDFWGVSVLEASERLKDMGVSSLVVLPELAPQGTAQIVDAIPLAEVGGLRDSSVGVYAFRRWDAALPAGCRPVFEIVRANQVLGYAGICETKLVAGP